MPDYSNGLIYDIVDTRDESVAYVGHSTLPLRQRFSLHVSQARRDPRGEFHRVLRALPAGTFAPRLIEHWPCTCPVELCKREQHWVDTLAPAFNTNKAYNPLSKREQDRASQLKHRAKYNARRREKITCSRCSAVVNRGCKWQHLRSIRCIRANF